MANRKGSETTEPVGPGASGPGAGKLSVVVVGDGVFVAQPLPASGQVIIGRDPSCAVRVDHGSISRRHATLHVGATIALEDLGSRNGTTVRRRRLERGERVGLEPGEVTTLGSVTLVLHRGAAALPSRRILGHAELAAHLEAECTRASADRTSFAVLRVLVASPTDPLALGRMLTDALGAGDQIAMVAPGEHEVLLAGSGVARVAEVSATLVKAGSRIGAEVAVGAATYPDDGGTPEQLSARASARARAGALDEPLVADPAMRELYETVARVAVGDISVLLVGETGAGKELVARAVHGLSRRRARPFLSLNCAALPEALLESELFGYERGAFTGALRPKPGLLEVTQGGTVFLDELGDMPPSVQAKLLRVLETREVMPLGGLAARPVDVRFVAATNHDLQARVQAGHFRQDLYYRLSGVTLSIPPLRERPVEIEALARRFIAAASAALGRQAPELGAEALAVLRAHRWPGNVRELRNVVDRAVLLCAGARLLPDHLKLVAMAPPAPPAAPDARAAPGELRDAVQSAERARIIEALDACGGNQTRAAKLLGVSRRTLVQRLEAYGIPRPKKP